MKHLLLYILVKNSTVLKIVITFSFHSMSNMGNISTLYDDVLKEVLSFLNVRSLFSTCQINKRWKVLSNQVIVNVAPCTQLKNSYKTVKQIRKDSRELKQLSHKTRYYKNGKKLVRLTNTYHNYCKKLMRCHIQIVKLQSLIVDESDYEIVDEDDTDWDPDRDPQYQHLRCKVCGGIVNVSDGDINEEGCELCML